jgi:drug/metabolite transporter (DMT)-like permease
LTGVAAIAAHGSIETLLHLSLNRGDLWILAAMVIYGVYAAMFRVRPVVHPLSFLVATMGIGSLMILPFYLWEIAPGSHIEGGTPVWLAMTYIAVFPSFIAYLFFNRAIELVGATRAGQSWHLMPVFGSILAVFFLGETLYLYHAIGIALIGAGIGLASVRSGSATRGQEYLKRRGSAGV